MSNKKLFIVQTKNDLNNLTSVPEGSVVLIPEGSIALVQDTDLIYEYNGKDWNEIGSLSQADLEELKELIKIANDTATTAQSLANSTNTALQAFLTGTNIPDTPIDTLKEIQNHIASLKNKVIDWNSDNDSISNKPKIYQGTGDNAIIIGEQTASNASGENAFSQGKNTKATHSGSHAGGLETKTGADYQTVIGKYNEGNNDSLFEVGNGDNNSNRKNAFEIKENGTILANGNKIATEDYIDTLFTNANRVKFTEDIVFTTPIGYITNQNIQNNNGQYIIEATEENPMTLKAVFERLFCQEINTNLQKIAPSTTISNVEPNNYLLIGATSTAQTATVSLNKGSYDYGYGYVESKNETGIVDGTVANTVITNNGAGAEAVEYIFTIDDKDPLTSTKTNVFEVPSTTKTAEGSEVIKAKIKYNKCGYPVSNLKKIYPNQKYEDDSTPEKIITVNTWYIPFYQGFTFSDDVIDTANITANDITTKLKAPAINTTDNKVTSTTTSVEITGQNASDRLKCTAAAASKAWRQYFIAYPKDWGFDMKDAKDSNGIDCTVNGPVEVTITHNDINVVYNVYYINNTIDYYTLGITWNIVERKENEK